MLLYSEEFFLFFIALHRKFRIGDRRSVLLIFKSFLFGRTYEILTELSLVYENR